MNFKKIVNTIYPIDEYKKLRKNNPLVFYLTILIPLAIFSLFFYFYFYPFGYHKEYTVTTEKTILGEKGHVSFQKEEKNTAGVSYLTYNPPLLVRNPLINISVEGNNTYLLPNSIDMTNTLDIWDFTTSSFSKSTLYGNTNLEENEFRNHTYATVDNYNIQDSQILTFYLRWKPESEENVFPRDGQLLLKYENLKILQNSTTVQLQIEEVYDGQIFTYFTSYFADPAHYNNEHELIAIYSKSTQEDNGYIELFVDGIKTERVVVASPYNLFYYYDDLRKYEEPLDEELLKDLNQQRISLGQEIYTVDMESSFPKELRNSVDLNIYYAENFKKEDPEYYTKSFLNYFGGYIYELRVGYEYPFEKITSLEALYSNTPVTIPIAGTIENIHEVNLTVTRDPLWKKLMNF